MHSEYLPVSVEIRIGPETERSKGNNLSEPNPTQQALISLGLPATLNRYFPICRHAVTQSCRHKNKPHLSRV